MPAKYRTNLIPIRFSDEEVERVRNMLHATGRGFQSFFHLVIMRETERIEERENGGKRFVKRASK